MLNVVRVRIGEEVTLLDGSGREGRARLLSARRGRAELETVEVIEADREPPCTLTIASAVPRGQRMDFLIEKCCELGVARLVPMLSARGVVDPTRYIKNRLSRWRRIVAEAAKQCGRTRFMEIATPTSFGPALSLARPDELRLIASPEPDAVPLGRIVREVSADRAVSALVGPEGGFTADELARARAAGFVPVSLGPRTLRVETAALAVAAVMLLEKER